MSDKEKTMQRYNILQGTHGPMPEEHSEGEWVRFEDVVPQLTSRDPAPNDSTHCTSIRESAQIWADNLILAALPAGLSLEDAERWAIIRAIKENRGNLRATARALQVGKTTLYRKLHIYGLRAREGAG